MLAGVDAFGFVSWSQVLETWPSMPPGRAGERDQQRSPGSAASTPSSTRPASRFACGEAGPLGGEEAGDEAEREQQHEHQQQQRAELVARCRRAPGSAAGPC